MCEHAYFFFGGVLLGGVLFGGVSFGGVLFGGVPLGGVLLGGVLLGGTFLGLCYWVVMFCINVRMSCWFCFVLRTAHVSMGHLMTLRAVSAAELNIQ